MEADQRPDVDPSSVTKRDNGEDWCTHVVHGGIDRRLARENHEETRRHAHRAAGLGLGDGGRGGGGGGSFAAS